MNKRKSKLTKAACRFVLAAFLAVVLLSLQMTSLLAQTTGAAKGQERKSRPGESQSNPKAEAEPGGQKMDPAQPLPASPINGKLEKMEDVLKSRPQAVTGNKQPDFVPSQATNPQQGSGEQKRGAPKEAQTAVSHLRLVLRVSEDGSAEVVTATEIAGEAIVSDEPVGDLIYEVTSEAQTLAVQALPDPFEMRSFPGPAGTPQQGHYISRAKTATIVVEVPKTNLESANLDKMTVRLYKIKPGGALIEKINPEVVKKLKQEDRLQMRLDMPGSKLAPQIRQKGIKMEPQ